MPTDPVWYAEQIEKYKKLFPDYKQLGETLEAMLDHEAGGICPCRFVTARPKSVGSFAEKIIRKKYTEPLKQMTDLCGARVIVHMREEVEAICDYIRRTFIIEESEDKLSRLRATEFGYRSWHYIVRLREPYYKLGDKTVEVCKNLLPLKAEIQVRTIIQHAWADIGHDRIYKSPVAPSDEWKREMARFAAQLETVDDGFDRLVTRIDALTPFAGREVDEQALQDEVDRLIALGEHDKHNPTHAHRVCRLYLSLDKWKETIDVVKRFQANLAAVKTAQPRLESLLTCLGVAQCRNQAAADGILALKEAASGKLPSAEAKVRLSEHWLKSSPHEALHWAQAAYDQAPWNPEAVCCLIRAKFANGHDDSFLRLLKPVIEEAIQECRLQAALNVNVPWSIYLLGELHMVLSADVVNGADHELPALEAYCQAIMQTPKRMAPLITAALGNLAAYKSARTGIPGIELVDQLLRLGRRARFDLDPAACPKHGQSLLPEELKSCATQGELLQPPVVIVVGGCDPSFQSTMEEYWGLMQTAFSQYHGTILSGGTREGIPGLVGKLVDPDEKGNRREQIRAVGYLPRIKPDDKTATEDTRYQDPRRTPHERFSAREPLQNWLDLLHAGIRPSEVTVLGINGGKIAALEYRLALMLGAAVGVVRDSGREANALKREAEQRDIPGLSLLPKDRATLQAFVMRGVESLFKDKREQAAIVVHDDYRSKRIAGTSELKLWQELDDKFKRSNLEQVDHIGVKLAAVGLTAVKVPDGTTITLPEEKDWEKHVEKLAEMEHGRYVAERMRDGWKLGPRDDSKKQRPSLIGWSDKDLPESEKEKDREAIRLIPKILADAGFKIQASQSPSL